MAKTCLFHSDYPKGKIFNDEDEPALLQQGWVDAEWKVKAVQKEDQEVKATPEIKDEPEKVLPKLLPWQKAQAARKAKRKLAKGV
jgi:hypothetical protein